MDPFTIAAGAAGAITSALGQSRANQQNREESERNRAFQKMMSDTSIQRSMKDFRKAGLNPILAAKQGASTPGGAMAAPMGNVGESGVKGASLALMTAQTAQVKANTALTETQTRAMGGLSELGSATGQFGRWLKSNVRFKDLIGAEYGNMLQFIGNSIGSRVTTASDVARNKLNEAKKAAIEWYSGSGRTARRTQRSPLELTIRKSSKDFK